MVCIANARYSEKRFSLTFYSVLCKGEPSRTQGVLLLLAGCRMIGYELNYICGVSVQQTFTCSKLAIEKFKKAVKYVQSYNEDTRTRSAICHSFF